MKIADPKKKRVQNSYYKSCEGEMNVGSLFSGIGGIELGFEREGFKTKWFIENDAYCQAVLRKNFPGIPVYDDITQIDFGNLEEVDVLTGGFPCQDVSLAGKRAGIEGKRSGLWSYFAEAIRILRPRIVVVENVPGLLTSGMGKVLGDLAESGYDAEWNLVSAASVGAPHLRERIFIVAYPRLSELQGRKSSKKGNERETFDESASCSTDVANSNNSKTSRQRENSRQIFRISKPEGFNRSCSEGRWAVEPDVGRVAHGVPSRVDRLKCLGNAVVPQVAQVIAKRIKEEYVK